MDPIASSTNDNEANITAIKNDTRPQDSDPVRLVIHNFLVARSDIFRELAEIREEGWKNPQGDKHFQNQRRFADESSSSERASRGFFNLMRRIGDEMQATTGILTLQEPGARVLDICMAPGGYSASALKYSPHARVSGISLPPSLGGHPLIIWHGTSDPRVEVLFADVTMFASEYSVTNFPANHPDLSNFSLDRPWANESFNLIFCDGQVLRTHAPHIASYREQCEAGRLACSQLILAMQRIKPGGSIVMLLHKVEMWQTVKLLSVFDKISELQLFKPLISHKTRGSFYLIAKNVQPYRAEALDAIKDWKCAWKKATFPGPADEGCPSPLDSVKEQKLEEGVAGLLANFGERLI